jgi:hypothetical protein
MLNITTTYSPLPCRVPQQACKDKGMCLYHHLSTPAYTQDMLRRAGMFMKWSSYYYLQGLTRANGRARVYTCED